MCVGELDGSEGTLLTTDSETGLSGSAWSSTTVGTHRERWPVFLTLGRLEPGRHHDTDTVIGFAEILVGTGDVIEWQSSQTRMPMGGGLVIGSAPGLTALVAAPAGGGRSVARNIVHDHLGHIHAEGRCLPGRWVALHRGRSPLTAAVALSPAWVGRGEPYARHLGIGADGTAQRIVHDFEVLRW